MDKRSYKNYFDNVIKFDPVNNYFIFTIEELRELKRNINPETISQLRKETEELFSIKKSSVTTKEIEIDGIGKNDYVSLATYWWKDETKPDGLPYVNRDGYANPEGSLYDKDKFRLLAYITYYGALMYYLTEDESYNILIKSHLSYWFLDEIAHMNPNMDHAQYIPGVNTGRGKGIIDYAANFAYSLHILTLLREEGMLDEKLDEGLKKWHHEFRHWCLVSDNGIEEKNTLNNHGTMFDFMMLIVEQYLENDINYKEYLNDLDDRLNYQVDESGKLTQELKRTKSKSYSLMGAKGLYDTAKLIEISGVKVKNPLLDLMIDYLKEMLVFKTEEWTYQQVTVFDEAVLIPLILELKNRYDINLFDRIDFKDITFLIPAYLFNLI